MPDMNEAKSAVRASPSRPEGQYLSISEKITLS